MKSLYIVVFSLLLVSCAGLPKNIEPVADFELDKYMGKWYEIARLDHSFERDLEQVTATYSIKSDGTVSVANRGLSSKRKEWKDAVGKAKFEGDSSVGYLKVSFFGPFYGSYVFFDFDI
jgi:apolipoprotein D and lipocalin family protein